MEVLNVACQNASDLSFALGLEQNQSHPVARAITNHLRSLGVTAHRFQEVATIPEGGVCADHDGFRYQVRPLSSNSAKSLPTDLRSTFGLFKNETMLASFEMADRPRPESLEVLNWARENGLHPQMLSGDRQHVVTSCAHVLGFSDSEIRAELSPEAKAEVVNNLECVMIGDGANDAPAFAAAGVGIAVFGSLDVSLRAADIFLTKPSLRAIPELFKITVTTKKAIYRNLVFSAAFNSTAGALAIAGLMTPLWAAILMPVSSLTVLVSALLAGREMIQKQAAT